MAAIATKAGKKTHSAIKTVIKYKAVSLPLAVVLVFLLIIAAYSPYYAVFEIYGPITNWYHNTLPLTPDQRHLFVRAGMQTIAAQLAVGVIFALFVKGGVLKYYPIATVPRMIGRALIGLLAAIPGIFVAYLGITWWHNHHIWRDIQEHLLRTHVAASVHVTVANPDTINKLLSVVTTDGEKKIAVLLGILPAAFLVMKPFNWNVQHWFAQQNVRKHSKANIRWYHHLTPAYRDHLKVFGQQYEEKVTYQATRDEAIEMLSPQNHTLKNSVLMWGYFASVFMAFGGGVYIATTIAHGS